MICVGKNILVAFLFAYDKDSFFLCLLCFKLLLNLYFGLSFFILCTTDIQGIISSQMVAKKACKD